MIDIIARGNKDYWAINTNNKSNTFKDKVMYSHIIKSYHKYIPIIEETRVLPFSGSNFGKQAKIVIPNFCDIYTDMYLQLNLQSFLKDNSIDLYEYYPVNQTNNFGYTQYTAYSCIENIQLYVGKLKIDEYNTLELFHKYIENTTPTQRSNIKYKLGYYNQTSYNDNDNVYQNQGGDLFLKVPFDLFSKHKPLPTSLVQGSPLEIRIKFRELDNLIYPKQNLQSIVGNEITFRNSTGNIITTTIQRPKLKFVYLHVNGLHVEEKIRRKFTTDLYKYNIKPFITYDNQEYLFSDPDNSPQICVGAPQKVPNNGDVNDYKLQLDFQNPVQTFTLYPQLVSSNDNNEYFNFILNNDMPNNEIISNIGLKIHGIEIYPKLNSQYYNIVTPYCTNANILQDTSFFLPLNAYNKDTLMNYGYIDYLKVNHSVLDLNITGWNENNRTFKIFIISKIYKKLEMENGSISFHNDFD